MPFRWSRSVPLLMLLLAACSTSSGDAPPASTATNEDGDAPLSDVDALFMDVPGNDTLPEEGKADAVYPAQYFDLVAMNTPVRSQARRGVCSIFSTTALMEHLYLIEGSMPAPDFSEQFLQWSSKVEERSFPSSEGANAGSNIRAVARFGIPVESAWPYQPDRWSAADDPACTGGEGLPTKCYTNGDPPASALEAVRWHLPTGRWINSNDRSIKAHMTTEHTGVVIGVDFFYQAWNHRKSVLPTNQDYWRMGYVHSPNDRDIEESHRMRAGHSILLVGWDDTLEVPLRDADGNPRVDASGNPVVDKGFFVFKNSWGTGSFGVSNPHGDGYGFISFAYVARYGSAYVSGVPVLERPTEDCTNGGDDDGDMAADCADSDCATHASCMGGSSTYESTAAFPIPDNDTAGIRSTIDVPAGAGTIGSLAVTVNITHPYRGDLRVILRSEAGGEAVLLDRAGGSQDDVHQTFAVTAFDGDAAEGTWTLAVIDAARVDVGTLTDWKLEIAR